MSTTLPPTGAYDFYVGVNGRAWRTIVFDGDKQKWAVLRRHSALAVMLRNYVINEFHRRDTGVNLSDLKAHIRSMLWDIEQAQKAIIRIERKRKHQ
jgi:hypothetical protein